MSAITTAKWTLILGTAFVFLYFGIEKFVHPALWLGWMPDWMDGLMGYRVSLWMQVVAVTEIALGALILVPVRAVQKTVALLASLHLVAILTQVGWNDTAVRDTGLLCMTTALWYLI